MTDNRLPEKLAEGIFAESDLTLLHHHGFPSPSVLKSLERFTHAPRALSFQRACGHILPWMASHPDEARRVTSLGDLHICPHGINHWIGDIPAPSVEELGLCVTTERYDTRPMWKVADVTNTILRTFPSLKRVGVNLEIAYDADEDTILQLLSALVTAGVEVRSGEVVLVQLPTNARRRDARLRSMGLGLRESGVVMTSPPRARRCSEVPSNGHSVPALFALRAPTAIQEEIASALWDSVWLPGR